MKIKLFGLLAIGLLSAQMSMAKELTLKPSYNYMDGKLLLGNDDTGIDYGIDWSVSRDISPSFNMLFGVESMVTEGNSHSYVNSISLNTLRGGMGAHKSIAPKTDIYGNATLSYSYLLLDTDYKIGRTKGEWGYGTELGIRHKLNSKVEFNAKIEYKKLAEDLDDTIFEDVDGLMFSMGGRAYLTNALSVGANYQHNTDVGLMGLNLRYDTF
ncbi:outer membrane beta-barrel protein [Thiofilum flexile]|uniref:outer membrane beta-barrel protein n=1 Tax=Thiofilum flexile TaxID=125627 RepID=UPI00035F0A24|nr:outer membrane beta-barrel protein [Thiofilum flexile]